MTNKDKLYLIENELHSISVRLDKMKYDDLNVSHMIGTTMLLVSDVARQVRTIIQLADRLGLKDDEE